MRTASWVIINKATGKVVFETFEKAMADAVDTAKYTVVPVLEYLASQNKREDKSP